jgi:CheY-like chemotaxis protein
VSFSELSCRSILVVDDDPDVRDAVASVLVDEGYGVTGVGSGREALQHLQDHMRPSLILLDMMMPRWTAGCCARN